MYKQCQVCGSKFWRGDLSWKLSGDSESERCCLLCNKRRGIQDQFRRLDITSDSGEETEDYRCDSQSYNIWSTPRCIDSRVPWPFNDEPTTPSAVSSLVHEEPLALNSSASDQFWYDTMREHDSEMARFKSLGMLSPDLEVSPTILMRSSGDWEEYFDIDIGKVL